MMILRFRRGFLITSLCVAGILSILFTLDFQFLPHQYFILQSEVTLNNYVDTLIDLQDFKFLMNNASICATSSGENHSSIVVLVHTARHHFNERYAIRNTWGSVKVYKGWSFHLAFVLGIDPTSDNDAELLEENKQHGDLIMGNFVDSYKNLTYKHLMGYKWVSTFCPTAKYILKTDDDIYVDVFDVVDVVLVELIDSKKTYACQNMYGNKPQRDPSNLWYVSDDLYPEENYPEFCSGGAYLLKADDATKIYSVCKKPKFLWIDDVFVTGILRETYNSQNNGGGSQGLDILTVNSRYNFSCKSAIKTWCSGDGSGTNPIKYIFVSIHKSELIRDMFCIWNEVTLRKYAVHHATADEINC